MRARFQVDDVLVCVVTWRVAQTLFGVRGYDPSDHGRFALLILAALNEDLFWSQILTTRIFKRVPSLCTLHVAACQLDAVGTGWNADEGGEASTHWGSF